jgi:hypothetical protein
LSSGDPDPSRRISSNVDLVEPLNVSAAAFALRRDDRRCISIDRQALAAGPREAEHGFGRIKASRPNLRAK